MLGAKALSPFAIVLAFISAALVLVAISGPARAHVYASTCQASGICPPPAPTPTPTGAFLTLDVTAGGATTAITVSGNSFLPNEAMSIYWDTAGKVIGSATANASGNFSNVHVKPFAGEPAGLHHICAGVNPFPCAQFELQAAPSPTPSAPPSPSELPSPSESPTPSGSPTPAAIIVAPVSGNGLDFLVKPPFVFLPILAVLGVLAAIVFWFVGASRRRERPVAAAAIVHRSVRPAYGPAVLDVRTPPLAAPVPPIEPLPAAPDALFAPSPSVEVEQPPWPSVDQGRPAWLTDEADEPDAAAETNEMVEPQPGPETRPASDASPSDEPPDAPKTEDYWPPV